MRRFGVLAGRSSRWRWVVVSVSVLAMVSSLGAVSAAQAAVKETVPLSAPSMAKTAAASRAVARAPYILLTPSTAIGAETVKVTGKLPKAKSRPVTVQRKSGKRWVTVVKTRTSRTGSYAKTFRAPKPGSYTIRTLAPRVKVSGKVRAQYVTPARTLRVVAQAAYLSMPAAVTVSKTATATLTFRPVRAGRAVSLQIWRSGAWATVANGRQSAAGTANLTAPAVTAPGNYAYRAMTAARAGVRASYSANRALSVLALPRAWTWSAPQMADAGHFLTSVSCPSPSFCAAVDDRGSAVTFNGTSWSAPVTLDPSNGTPSHYLRSVSCPSTSFCAAVDKDMNAMTFNGTSWSAPVVIAPPEDDPFSDDELMSVSCPSASFCAAVSLLGKAVTFNGTSWSAPQLPTQGTRLRSVSCASASFCVAVTFSGKAVTFNGTSWSVPQTIASGFYPKEVSCPLASSFCVTVDAFGSAVKFNGTSWSAPQEIAPNLATTSVSCPSVLSCVAVDDHGSAMSFNGTAWSAPQVVLPNGSLKSVSCPSVSFCVAVAKDGSFVTGR